MLQDGQAAWVKKDSRLPLRLARVRECAADVRRASQGFGGQYRHIRPGEKGDMQCAPLDVGCDPLGVIGATEGIFVEESLLRRYIEPIKISATARAGVGIEDCAGFRGLKRANLRDGECAEVDGDFVVGKRQVAGDVIGVGTGSAPVTFILCCKRKGADQQQAGNGAEQNSTTHLLRMTFIAALDQATGVQLSGLDGSANM